MRTTCGLVLCWPTNKFSSFCSLSSVVPADAYLSAFPFFAGSPFFPASSNSPLMQKARRVRRECLPPFPHLRLTCDGHVSEKGGFKHLGLNEYIFHR